MRENTTGTSEHNGAGGADAIEMAARAAAATLNREALYTTYETNYATVQNDRDELRKRLNVKDVEAARQSEENKRLKLELANVKREMEGVDESKEEMRGLVSGEKSKHNDTLRQLECERERVDRGERESDALRKEISRLTTSNAEYNTLLNSMTTQHSKSSSEALPLRLQVKRLEQELEAVQGHANYLDGELASRNESIGSLKLAHSNELRTIKGELTQTQISLGQLERELTASRMTSAQTSKEVERLQTKLYNVQMDYTSQKELFEQDLNSERELVGLKEQRMLLAEDARASLMREVEELKSHAKVAAEEATKMEDEMQSRFNEGIEEAVLDVREEEQQKRDMLEERLQIAEDAKLRLEDDILNRPTPRKRRIEGGGAQQQQPLAIIDGNNSLVMLEGSDDPLSLTDLYTRLASTEDELRTAQHENQKLRVVISRIQRDVAAKTPLYHQKQVELENALEELEVAQERLDYARREVTDIRADNQDFELRYKQVDRECGEWKRENKDLAMQVQSLLQRRSSGDMVTFEDISSLQSQNQMLLRDHHSMTDKIAELEDKMKNNDDANELSNLRTEVGSLREAREKQTNLVAGIVHQRDLYRALVAKNDAPLLQGENQLAIADAKAEQLPMIEAKNADLTEEVSKLRAEVSTTKHENEALVGRLARVDTHANELTTSNELLRGEMTAAKATAARLEIDVSHYQGKCERLENSLEMIKAESASESKRKAQLEDLLNKTQNHLDTVRGELAKKEQRYQQASSKMRLLEVQLETSTSNEKRMESEALSLRSEIARQETLLTSVQRIEASLTAKSESELETLQEELKRLQESKSDDNKKQSEAVQKLEGKIADLELSVKELTTQKEEATVTATKANLEVSKSKVNISELTLKLKSTEKELTAAKVKLGDVTIDTSAEEVLEAKVATLTTELDSTKSDLETAQKRIADYQAIAKLAEEQVTELTAASTKYKDETTVTLEKLRKSEQSQREAVTELTNDLMNHRAEKDKAVNELKAKSDSLTSQLAGAKDDASKAIANMESLADEAKRYQLDFKNSNGNYERELALHADARTALRDARSSMETEQRLRETAESQLAMTTAEIETERGAWEVSKTKLEKSLSEAKKRFDDMRSQNNLLHDQMTALSSTVDKFQSEKTSQLVGGGSSGDKADEGTSDEKQLSDLRELLKFKQSECTMLEADLASAKRASERERTAAELAKRSLQEARSELKVLRESGDSAASGSTEKEMDDLHAKLKTAEEQLVLLRESNTMLREESQKVTKKLSEVQSQLTSLKSSTAPATEKMKAMEVERAALVAEKDSLSREVDAWKNRVHSLVSKFNQIDPEEHEQALATVEKLKKECSTLKTQKEAADGNSTKAKNIVTRLNKEISSQKASMEAFKTALEKTKKEKELLTKSAKAAQITSKKITEAQEATKKADAELTTSKSEVTQLNSRLTNFKKMMTKMQTGLKTAKAAENKAKSTEESLKSEIAGLKQQLERRKSTEDAAAPSSEAAQPAATEKPQATKEGEKEAASASTPAPTAQKSDGKETKEATATTDSSKTPAAESNIEKAADAAAVEKATDLAEAASKKKGKKRKAAMPKKNAAAAVTETTNETTTKAPPQKKAATPAAKKQTAVTKAKAAAESAKAPSQKKDPPASDKATESSQKKVAAPAPATKTETPVAEALISLAKGPMKMPAKKSVDTTKKDAPAATETAASKKEEELKAKMALLKKRKAAALAKKIEAEQKLAAKKKQESEKSPETPSADSSDKSGKVSEGAENTPEEPKVVEKSSESQAAPATAPKETLPPVPEQSLSDAAKADGKKTESSPKPIFGSSATLTKPPMTLGMPKSEPDCPKPSFFGSSTAAPTTSIFGGVVASAPTGFGGVAKSSKHSKAAEGGLTSSGSGAFLSLTPPKAGSTPGKFVFGKSANITLAVPAGGSPMAAQGFASFGGAAKFGSSTPFGGGAFGCVAKSSTPFGTIPFGGGDASKKRPLSTSDEMAEEPDAKQSRKEEGEVVDEAEGTKTAKDAAAKEA